jgi:hypothetical protein
MAEAERQAQQEHALYELKYISQEFHPEFVVI